jgi:hypothetical protein
MGVAVLLLASLGACTTVHGVRPAGKGALVVEGSLGGPLTEVYGAFIPLPISAVGATYGLDDKTDIHAAWHPSAAAFYGLFAADFGVSREFLRPAGARPRVMADLTLTVAGGDNEQNDADGGTRLWVQPTITASWDWGKQKRQTTYAGITAFTQPFPTVRMLPAVVAGQWWGLGPRLHLTTEFKWIAPTTSSLDAVPTYAAPGAQGAISFQLGLGYRFGGRKETP